MGNSDDDDEDDIEIDTDSEDVDECILTQNDCDSLVDDDGDRECAYNSVSSDCYSIERREGRLGSGNFDDGYNAAQVKATKDMDELNTIVGILGAIVAILVVIIAISAWFFYSQNNKVDFEHERTRVRTMSEYNEDDDKVNVDIVECVAPNTNGTDRDPMLF